MAPIFALLRITPLGRVVFALLLLIIFALTLGHWSAQQSLHSACLVLTDSYSGTISLADTDRGVSIPLRQPRSGPYLFTTTFPKSPVQVYADQDIRGDVYEPYLDIIKHRGIFSVQEGPFRPHVPIGSFYYPDLSHQTGKITYHTYDYVHLILAPDARHLFYIADGAGVDSYLNKVALDGSEEISRPLDTGGSVAALDLSPNGQYLITGSYNGEPNGISLWEATTLRLIASYSPGDLFTVQDNVTGWSPDSKYYAYSGETEGGQLTFGVISVGDGREVSHSDADAENYFLTNAHWSPDSKKLYLDGTLLDVEHGTFYDLSTLDPGAAVENIFWSEDSSKLIALVNDVSQPEKVALWQVYSLDNGKITALHDILAWTPNPLNGNRVVIAWLESNGNIAIDVMDMDTSARKHLVDLDAALPTDYNDYTQMQWSPDGVWIAVPWRNPFTPGVGLTIVRADGSQSYVLSDAIAWKWLEDGKALAYLTKQMNGQSAEILNFMTGKRQLAINDAKALNFIATPGISDLLGIWWQASDLSPHVSAYQLDGTLVYRADGTSLMDPLAPQSVDWAEYGQLVRSPDKQLALVFGIYGEYIALVKANNQVIRLPIRYSDEVTWNRCD